jgi:hypothetical protein
MIVALFDSDGTLYAKQFGRGMMEYANTHGLNHFNGQLPKGYRG